MTSTFDRAPRPVNFFTHIAAFTGAVTGVFAILGLIVTLTSTIDGLKADIRDNHSAIADVQDRMRNSNILSRVQILEDREANTQADETAIRAEFHDIQSALNQQTAQIATLTAKLDYFMSSPPPGPERGSAVK